MANKTNMITEDDNAIIESFFKARPHLNPEDFDVRLSKAGNLMAIRRGSENADGNAVFDRLNGELIALGPAVEHPNICKTRREAKKEKRRRFSEYDVETALNAAKGSVCDYDGIVEDILVKMPEDGLSLNVEFICERDSALVLNPVSIPWFKKCRDAAVCKRHISSYLANLQPVPSPDTIRKARELVFRFVKKSTRKYGDLNAKTMPFSKVLPDKVTKSVCSLLKLSAEDSNKMNVKFGNGKLKLTYKHIAFECNINISSPRFTRTCQEHIKRFDDAWRHRKSLTEIVEYASELEIPGYLSFDYDKGILSIQASSRRASQIVQLTVLGSYKRLLGKFASSFSEQDDQARQKALSSAAVNAAAGNLLALAAAVVVHKNSDYITENATVKILRGLKISDHYELVQTPYDGQFNIVSEDEIRDAIRLLVCSGLLWRKFVDGKYTDYYLLKPSEQIDDFIEAASSPAVQVESLGKEAANKRETVRIATYSQRPSQQNCDDDLDFLIEHPALLCCATEAISTWLTELPEEYKEYVGLRAQLEDDVKKKKYLKLLLSASKGEAVSTEKVKRTASSSARKNEPKFKPVISQELSSRWDTRYVVVETATGDVVDTAQGFGFKTPNGAMNAWNYKRKHEHSSN